MNEDGKKKYVQKADEDKKRYEKEKAAYDAKNSGEKTKKKQNWIVLHIQHKL